MSSTRSIALVLCLLGSAASAPHQPKWSHKAERDGLIIHTTSGTVQGFVNNTAPDVRTFLGVPYAEPPVGNLRFAPPVPKSPSGPIDAIAFAPSCMQQAGSGKTIYTEEVPEFLINGGQSEDCLYLNIWAPKAESCRGKKLPVFVYIPGGGFTSGGADSVYKIPDKWIQRTQSHIVVIMNYRVNVFGFPNARGLEDRNVGLLDQRLVVEWTRNNIERFGGDATRITLWGQSAGGASSSLYGYAWADDPIITSSISDSGVAGVAGGLDIAQTNFTALAGLVDCSNLSAEEELACVRKVSAADLEQTLSNYIAAGQGLKISFTPVPDNVTVFSNYKDRAAKGLVAQIPAIVGSNANEGAGFVPFTPGGPGAATLANVTNQIIACPVAREAHNRATNNVSKTYRYQYLGNFTNVSPLPWMGAYHSSELPLLFGTHYEFRGNSTKYEYQVSHFMEALWLSFASNPHEAPKALLPSGETFQWPDFEPDSQTLVRIADGDNLVYETDPNLIDDNCSI